MNHINFEEVYCKSIRSMGTDAAQGILKNFLRLLINIILADGEMIWKASGISAEYPISYAKCSTVTTAINYHAAILTGNPEFKKQGGMFSEEWR